MSNEWDAAGAGAGGGAAAGAGTGAAIGTMFAPGFGTAVGAGIGAGVGALAGGASGYLSGKGASKRKKAQKKAQREYEAALRNYEQQSEANLAAQRQHAQSQGALAQQNFQNYLAQMPGDQTASLQNDYGNQMAALQTTQPALSGPLAEQYAQEMQGRTQAALTPMAYDYATGQQGQAVIANDRNYDLSTAAMRPNDTNFGQRYNLTQSALDANRAQAEARFGVQSQKAQNAGAEQMMYGGMLNSALGLGGQIGSTMAQNNRYNNQFAQQKEMYASQNRGNQSVGVLRPNTQANMPYYTGMR